MTVLRLPLLAVTVALALAACKPADAPQASTPPQTKATTTPAATTPGTDATSAVDQAPAAEVTDKAGVVIDAKALAGEFEGNGSTLILEADGAYTQTLNAGGAQLSSSGTWSAAGPGLLLLDPQDKAAQDVHFEVVSADELHSQDGTYTFKRAR
ncbi:hypothetical protein [Pseudoxanthomonas spadix]|uniref:hypothetical protein n=1 Tax=Pseudoxanthomonas spadix TaxID=415229 RepID=UPI000EFDF490|nr:hypothetical protein [Pseudoxanthomonas spadix]MBP3975421.1 hypothetical protein [Pseudoxanthomonas spadix]RMW96437.1 hypothetical protein D9R12_06015 [Pseudoxanthomonas spadix]